MGQLKSPRRRGNGARVGSDKVRKFTVLQLHSEEGVSWILIVNRKASVLCAVDLRNRQKL